MTREELKAHCERQIEMCETWAYGKGEKPSGKVYEEHKLILELLEQTRWIPVSERLPKNSGVYIVSRWFSDGLESAILTDACYFDGTSTWHNDNRINHGREYVDKKIVAWMPLPEPYKTESED